MKTLLRLFQYARPVSRYLTPFVIFSLLAILFGILNLALIIPLLRVLFDSVSPEAMKQMLIKPDFAWSASYFLDLFNYYFASFAVQYGKMGALWFVCGVVVTSVLLSNFFRYLSSRILEHLRAQTIARLREAVFGKALSLDLNYFSNERKGNVMSRITTDVQEVEYAIASAFIAVFKEPAGIITYFITLFLISAKLTFFTLIIIPLAGLLISTIIKRMKKDAHEGQSSLGRLVSILDETFGGMRVVKAFNATGYVKEKFAEENRYYQRVSKSLANKRELASPFSEFTGVLVVSGIVLYGGSLVLSSNPELSAELFIGYIVLFSQVMRPVKEIANSISSVQRGIASGERVLELIDTAPQIRDKPGASVLTDFHESIVFDNVSFGYNTGVNVLNNVSFTLAKGKTIALVGTSGGGKSTIADLLPRFYDPLGGSIHIDGIDIRDCTIESLRSLMGIVTQESVLFNDTIFNNIAFNTKATEDQVLEAARIANAHDFITDMPQGYQSVIGDRGGKLSGGQRQRISIARAVLRNPPLLILDEATSALDAESEKLVQEALTKLMQNRTSLVIAHRLATIQHADEILVVQQGSIVERGTHETLREVEDGMYKKLSLMQLL